MEKTVNNLMSIVDWGQSGNNGLTMYSLSVRQMIDSMAGFNINTDIQENKKANGPPKASNMYEYSAPDLLIRVPNSA